MGWRDWLAYPDHVPVRTADLLDEAATLIPDRSLRSDRFVALTLWLRELHSAGLISGAEYMTARSDLAPNL